VPAAVLGIKDAGAITAGSPADLVILDANPLQDIRGMRCVHWTVSRGNLLDPQRLWNAVDVRPTALPGCGSRVR
jgi:imidazolonepropionase-like amidohydrolase